MKHQLKEGMAARCANAQELRSAINAIKAADGPIWTETVKTPQFDGGYRILIFTASRICRSNDADNYIPLHEFILRALGQWIEEPKELTLGVAKELLKESISHVLNNDCVGQRKWAAKLAEYGIKP